MQQSNESLIHPATEMVFARPFPNERRPMIKPRSQSHSTGKQFQRRKREVSSMRMASFPFSHPPVVVEVKSSEVLFRPRVYYHFSFAQELSDNSTARLEISAAIILQIKNKTCSTLLFQFTQCLLNSSTVESANLEILM